MILVDGITEHATSLRYKRWSHMVSTVNADELHMFAARIGLKRGWFQSSASFDHYDVTPPKRAAALQLGAHAVDARILLFANYDYVARRPGVEIPQPYRDQITALKRKATSMDAPEHDLGHGIVIRWDADGHGFIWRHPGCRAWSTLRFQPDPASTGHRLVRGGPTDVGSLTIAGSLLCPGGCGAHGEIIDGRWRPA